jgi:glutamate carboxypeptidase
LVLRSRDTQRQIPDTRMNWTLLRAEDARPMQPAPADFRRATLVFRVKGRASHAGVSPQDGVNAVVELAALIGRVSEVAGRQSGWLWRWRQASGGQVSNVIPDQASATLEIFLPRGEEGERRLQALWRAADARLLPRAAVSHELLDGPPLGLRGSTEAWAGADTRVPNLPAFDLLKEQAAKGVTAARFPGLSISLDGQVTFLPFNANEEAKALAALASEINQGLGGKPLRLLPRTTGATDAAWAAQSGKPVLEGFGLPGGGYHTNDDEFILHETIPRRVTLAAEMVRSACRR